MQRIKINKHQSPPPSKGTKFLEKGDRDPKAKAMKEDTISILLSVLDWEVQVNLRSRLVFSE